MMLHTKYQGSRPCGYRQEDFHCFPYLSLCKTCDPRGGSFWPQEQNLNKHGRAPLDDASYQISTLETLWFQTRRFFHVSPNINLCKTCDPEAGPFLAPGA